MLGFIFECIIDYIIEAWMDLMCLIVPSKKISTPVRWVLKLVVIVFCSILLIMMFMGLVCMILGDSDAKVLGRHLFFIPLGISALQVGIGLMLKNKKKQKSR